MIALPPAQRARYERLAAFCYDDYYPPMDGPYQNFSYFRRAGLARIRGCWRRTLRLIRAGRAPAELGLYLHWPFCPSRCGFCFCSVRVPRGAAEPARYADGVRREIAALADLFAGFALGSIWLGGGTPSFLEERPLDELLAFARASFALAPGAQVYVECSPATLTPGKIAALARRGVNRATLGVQSNDPAVLRAAGRMGQSRAGAEGALRALAGAGMAVDLDLLCGLPGQSARSFLRDLRWALRLRPDALHLFAYEPRPQTGFARRGYAAGPERALRLRALMLVADRAARADGYRVSRLDPGTLEPDCPEERQDSAVRRLGASVLGVGASAISHAWGSAWYCHPLAESRAWRPGAIPPFYWLPSPPAEEMRGFALRHLALFGRLDRARFRARFGRDPLRAEPTARALRALERWGGLRRDNGALALAEPDPVERAVLLKRLYSARVLRALPDAPAVAGADARALIRGKLEARRLFAVYFRPA